MAGGWAHSCASCGLLGWRERRRARAAQELADAGLAAFFARLGEDVRAERVGSKC